ncbi:MAG TPA: nucleotide-binding domain containing protein [Devosia sp.]|nr:nucleotide-binding domain containing protein [Devosia sp.]
MRAFSRRSHPTFCIEPDAVISGTIKLDALADWVMANVGPATVPLVYSSANPAMVRAAQDRYGRERLATAFEDLFGELTELLVWRGISKIIAAGGETSGAIVKALKAEAFEIGPEIDPGVPALRDPEMQLWLALKSGNFGATDFFAKAARVLGGGGTDE